MNRYLLVFGGVCSTLFFASCGLFSPKKEEMPIVLEAPKPTTPPPTVEPVMKKYAPAGKTSPELLQIIGNDVFVKDILSKPEDYNVQIIYTQINRDAENRPKFTTYTVNEDPNFYFYPASMVKMPLAFLALQKINELKANGIAIDKFSTMITGKETEKQTEVLNDPTTPDGRPSIAQYIKKVFLVSDNDASNRLYEFLGQSYINNTLQKMGYKSAEIIHRLSIPLSLSENKFTNPIRFIDSNGKNVYEQAMQKSDYRIAKRNITRGKGYMSGGKLVNQPFDFSEKNRLSLTDMHEMVKAVIFPDAIEEKKRFNLTDEDRKFLLQYMSQLPSESAFPSYNPKEVWDSYVKFNVLGGEKNSKIPNGLRIFNKVGFAYGYITDAAYIVDFEKGVEFLLSINIYANNDNIFNDDKYNTDDIALPFMKKVGQAIYEYEKKRKKSKPNLSDVMVVYDK